MLAFFLLLFHAREKRRERQLLINLRDSKLYIRLYHKIEHLMKHYDIDQLRIEQHGVTVTSVYPAHTLLNFDFKQNGNEKRSVGIARLVAQLLQEDFPALATSDIYRLQRYRVYRLNGKKDEGFSFTMRRRFKDQVISSRTTTSLRIIH